MLELINPNQIARCVIGDLYTPADYWRTQYFCTKRTPWYLRIFGVNKDKSVEKFFEDNNIKYYKN